MANYDYDSGLFIILQELNLIKELGFGINFDNYKTELKNDKINF